MEVLRNNFDAFLPQIEEAIASADFIAIDTEFTGLGIGPDYNIEYLDTVQERYAKGRLSAEHFQITQYGICPFQWDEDAKQYLAKPFNCFVFPHKGNHAFGLDRQFACQAGSMVFLRDNKFDFNTWISQGVPYVNNDDEANARMKIGASVTMELSITGANRVFVEEAIVNIQDWLQNSPDQTLNVPCPTSFHRRLVHQEVKKRYRFNGALKTSGADDAVAITKLSVEERSAPGNDREHQLLKELEELVGFRKVIELVSKSQKPVVGHNMFLDVLQTFSSFYKTLPIDVREFRNEMHSLFPLIYDTKHFAHSNSTVQPHIPKSVLADVFKKVSNKPFEQPQIALASGFDGYEAGNESRYHEAGYDAYVTGVAFARMAALATSTAPGERISMTHQAMLDSVNKLHFMRSDTPHLDVAADQPAAPLRTGVFHVHGFDEGITYADVQREFDDLRPVTVYRFRPGSCFVGVRDPDVVHEVLKGYGSRAPDPAEGANSFPYEIETYREYADRAERRTGDAEAGSSPPRKRRRRMAAEERDDAAAGRSSKAKDVARKERKRLRKEAATPRTGPPSSNCSVM
ncbi:hypothetical protein HKX48_002275 [Thoreauomyces humboldtii]|nr:hypothetical protein HKX48_002275 [Thoreauomyces humboldtii]